MFSSFLSQYNRWQTILYLHSWTILTFISVSMFSFWHTCAFWLTSILYLHFQQWPRFLHLASVSPDWTWVCRNSAPHTQNRRNAWWDFFSGIILEETSTVKVQRSPSYPTHSHRDSGKPFLDKYVFHSWGLDNKHHDNKQDNKHSWGLDKKHYEKWRQYLLCSSSVEGVCCQLVFPSQQLKLWKKYISMNISRSVIPIFIKHIDKASNLVLSDNEVVILFCSAHRTVAFDHCRERKCKNKTKLGDAICISNLKLSMAHWLTGVGARRCYCI